MTLPLEGKVALVTGSSRGIGKAIALELAREGCDIVVCARSLESTDDLPGSIGETADAVRALGRRALPVKMDIFDDDDLRLTVDAAVREFGRIDILVNNAAYVASGPILESNVEDLDRSYRANVRAPFLLTQMVAHGMVETGGGVVVNISSPSARHPPPPAEIDPSRPRYQRGPEYGVSKAALDRLSTGIAEELAAHDIAVVSIWPGFTLTERLALEALPGFDMSRADPMDIPAKAVALVCKDPMPHTGRVYLAKDLLAQHGL
jgi:NAD(P)-dependent dehydrogenase (short-subunit alcohol dehydrogenase family)